MIAMEILVTGGAGYLGAVLCGELLRRGHRVRCLDTLMYGRESVQPLLESPGFRLLETSIADAASLPPAVSGCEAVIHLAGLADDRSCAAQPELARAVNVGAALHLAELCRDLGIHRFVNASSCSVYGDGGDEFLSETSPVRPVSLYARCKLEVERALNAMASGDFVPVHLRQATLFGFSPRMRFDLVVNAMTRDALAGGLLTVRGGGRQWRPFLHVADAAEALATAAEAEDAVVRGEVFNVGCNRANHRILEIAQLVQSELPGVRLALPVEEPDRRSYRVDFHKVQGLGWSPRRTVRDGVVELSRALHVSRAAGAAVG